MECYELGAVASEESCLKECKGMYSTVHVDRNNRSLVLNGGQVNREYEAFFKEYLLFKRAYSVEFDDVYEYFRPYKSKKGWPFINEQAVLATTLFDSFGRPDQYEVEQRLEVIKIYFKAPTFDKVTRDARTNFVTKLSMIGGMLGLFTGVSVISAIEILYFAILLVTRIFKHKSMDGKNKKTVC